MRIVGSYNAYEFPLIQLPKKLEADGDSDDGAGRRGFPLIQLPKKLEEFFSELCGEPDKHPVSINSTSEEVRSGSNTTPSSPSCQIVSINSTSEEVRSRKIRSCTDPAALFPLIQLPKKLEEGHKPNKTDCESSFH